MALAYMQPVYMNITLEINVQGIIDEHRKEESADAMVSLAREKIIDRVREFADRLEIILREEME